MEYSIIQNLTYDQLMAGVLSLPFKEQIRFQDDVRNEIRRQRLDRAQQKALSSSDYAPYIPDETDRMIQAEVDITRQRLYEERMRRLAEAKSAY